MEKLTRREFNDQLNRVGGFREYMPNLQGWTDDEIWEQLPDQDPRFAQGEEGLSDLLGDIPYKDE